MLLLRRQGGRRRRHGRQLKKFAFPEYFYPPASGPKEKMFHLREQAGRSLSRYIPSLEISALYLNIACIFQVVN